MQTVSIQKELLTWYRRQKRSLPWRGTSDPYKIWVSEVMLQQTTVAAVRERYEKFLSRFPDLASLARAHKDAVLAAWSGLGYYARARNLRDAARRILRNHGGRFPRDPAILEALPGVGPYIAAAVASIAFGARAPAAEANVTRVLSRLYALAHRAGSRRQREAVLERVRPLLPRRRPGDALAALMDLGQRICLPRKPDCGRCPLSRNCVARERGTPLRYPARQRKHPPIRVHMAAVFAKRNGRTLLVRRRASFLNGLWEFPCAEGKTPEAARDRLGAAIRPLGLHLYGRVPFGHASHTIVNRRISIDVYPGAPQSQITNHQSPITLSRWFRPSDFDRAPVPTLTRKIARAAGFLPRTRL